MGWRLGCIRSDSSRDTVHDTGRPSNQAASAVWAWLAMSSLPPNAPPLLTSSTVICWGSMASTEAIWSRSSHTPWPPEYTCRPLFSVGAARVDSGSKNACSMRWVWNTSWMVWALAASAASTSPRAYTERDKTLPSSCHTASSAPLVTAATASVIGGWTS